MTGSSAIIIRIQTFIYILNYCLVNFKGFSLVPFNNYYMFSSKLSSKLTLKLLFIIIYCSEKKRRSHAYACSQTFFDSKWFIFQRCSILTGGQFSQIIQTEILKLKKTQSVIIHFSHLLSRLRILMLSAFRKLWLLEMLYLNWRPYCNALRVLEIRYDSFKGSFAWFEYFWKKIYGTNVQ